MRTPIFADLVVLQAASPIGSRQEPLDVWQLVFKASPVVQLVLLLLLLMSVISWFIVGAKFLRLRQASQQSTAFLELFFRSEDRSAWTVDRLEAIYDRLRSVDKSPLARVFHAGYVELARLSEAQGDHEGDHENIERALRRAVLSEVIHLESMVPFLATTGSTAPFIGLFGTVWGIMNSFISIRNQKNTSLDVVGGDIAEALIVTAAGLAAAIPAVMAYNYFVRRIRVLESEMDTFASDYLNILRRHFLVREG